MSKSQITRRKTFYVRFVWDAEAGVLYCNSDMLGLLGLQIAATTLDAFEALMI
jgi:hypothetical protein